MPGNVKHGALPTIYKDDFEDVIVTKNSLDEAINLIFEEEDNKEKLFGGPKSLRECHSASIKAHGLRGAAEIFTSENATAELLEQLRISLLENNTSATAKLLDLLINSTTSDLLPAIWKSAIALFLDERHREQGRLDEFLEMCTGQRDIEDKRGLIEKLVYLPELLEFKSRSEPRHDSNKPDEVISIFNEDEDIIFLDT